MSKALLCLLLATALWGITFPLMDLVVHDISPGLFVLARFVVAIVAFLPFWKKIAQETHWSVLKSGILIALIDVVLYLSQMQGLKTTTAPRAAFIVGSAVIIVPLLMPCLGLAKATLREVMAALIFVLGLYLYTGSNFAGLTVGYLWEVLAAFCSALAIVYVQLITPRSSEFLALTFYQILFVIPFAFPFAGLTEFSVLLSWRVMGVVLFCGVFASAFAFWLQMKYQQQTTASKAALVYAIEPVFAMIFSHFLGQAPISRENLVGGAVMLLALILAVGRLKLEGPRP